MHLGDMGTRESQQVMNETLLEHENEVLGEVADALKRIEQGTFGRCENCGKAIARGRLDAIPYARYCARCADKLQSEQAINVDSGRPHAMPGEPG